MFLSKIYTGYIFRLAPVIFASLFAYAFDIVAELKRRKNDVNMFALEMP